MVRYIFAILLTPLVAMGATYEIDETDLPYTFSASSHSGDAEDTILWTGGNVGTAGDGIAIDEVSHVRLDMQGDTIYFGQGSNTGNTGLNINGPTNSPPHHITVVNGGFIHDPPDPSVASSNLALNIHGYELEVRDVYFLADNDDGDDISKSTRCASSGRANDWWIDIVECTFINNSDEGYRRDYYTQACFHSHNWRDPCETPPVGWTGPSDYEGFYHLRFDSNTVFSHHAGVVFYGRRTPRSGGILLFRGNNIEIDATNELYSYPSGDTHYGSGNAYGLVTTYLTGTSEVSGNTITSGENFEGGRGLYFGTMTWTTGCFDDTVHVYDNYINVHQGPGDFFNPGTTHGIRVRQNNNQWLQIYDNTIITHADDDPSTTHTTSSAYSIRWSPYQGTSDDCEIRNNLIICSTDVNGGGVDAAAVLFDAATVGSANLVFKNNDIRTQAVGIKFGGLNGGAPGFRLGPGDSIRFISPTVNAATFQLGHLGNNWDCSDNMITDPYFFNGASVGDIDVESDGTLELTVQRTLKVFVQGSNSLPVTNADVSVVNALGDTVLQGQTTSGGLVTGAVTMRYESRTQTDTVVNDVNPFTLVASQASDTFLTTGWYVGFTADSAVDTVTLSSTTGTGSWNNASPVISGMPPGNQSYTQGDTVQAGFKVTDDNGLQDGFLWMHQGGDSTMITGNIWFDGRTEYSDTQDVELDFQGGFFFRVLATDISGLAAQSTTSQSFSAAAETNSPPVVTFTSPPAGNSYSVGDSLPIILDFSDDHGLDTMSAWLIIDSSTVGDTIFSNSSLSGTSQSRQVDWELEDPDIGVLNIVVRVADDSSSVVTDTSEAVEVRRRQTSVIMTGDVFIKGDVKLKEEE